MAEQFDELDEQSGLGRGLASILPKLARLDDRDDVARGRGLESLIPEGEAGPRPADADPPRPVTPVDALMDELADGLLGGLANTLGLDLAVYLHVPGDGQPRVQLRAPALGSMSPTAAYELFGALRAAFEEGRLTSELTVGEFGGLTVTTSGPASAGIYGIGRRVLALTDVEREVAADFCRSLGSAVHQLAAEVTAQPRQPTVAVSVDASQPPIRAQVEIPHEASVRSGRGQGASTAEAVARAVAEAGGDVAYRYASEVTYRGQAAAVVLLEGADGELLVGGALSADGTGHATARAALRALQL